jgi:tRNA dimethylallyltransferase
MEVTPPAAPPGSGRAGARQSVEEGAHHSSRHRTGTVLAVVGPTASGKTELALAVSRILPCEIVSADSRQVYRHMAVGTAQPSAGEMEDVPHHFVGMLEPDVEFNAGKFGALGRATIAEIFRRGRVPLVVGGSGLYLRSLLRGLFEGPGAEQTLRSELEGRLRSSGAAALLEELRKVDPAAAEKLLPANTRRIVRALEVHALSGRTISELQAEKVGIPFDVVQVGLRWPRAVLYGRIDARVIAMINAGLVEETRRILDLGFSPDLRSLQSVGYREAIAYIGGRITHREMIAKIQMNTRRFAKRQMTWFRADPEIRWLDVGSPDEIPRLAAEVAGSFPPDRRVTPVAGQF